MIKNIISLLLLVVSVSLNFKHSWDMLHYKNDPRQAQAMIDLGISERSSPFLVLLTFAVAVLITIPRTFFLGNTLNAISILLIMAMALKSGNWKLALIEIPFLAMPLILIWLKYPFKN
ncbi:MAG: hypothetical protein J7527_12410 [Chitinophagaceae bacterium]|nr:hypothetical protein [Chitinophagaceae bacterium]